MQDITILYVDDEINNLSSFKAAFRFDYKVILAQTTSEALNYLVQYPDINIVLCDNRMPGTSGVDFLEEVRLKFPKPVRMLITGYTELEPLIDAINRGNIYRYIKKPWTELELKAIINEGYKYYLTNSLLATKNNELQSAYRQLEEFAYNVTHGLRDPILSVLSMVEIAQHMDNVPEDVREILDMVGNAMMQLDNYVENTHDYHKLKTAKADYSSIWFNEMLGNITDIYEPEMDKKAIELSTVVNQQIPLRSDESLVHMIVNNLLSNAVKYQQRNNADKFVKLTVDVNEDEAVITIEDNGIGIPTAHLQHIFDPLFRATSVEYGSGLGLYNVKDALAKLQGDITVESEQNKGSIFRVTIPNQN